MTVTLSIIIFLAAQLQVVKHGRKAVDIVSSRFNVGCYFNQFLIRIGNGQFILIEHYEHSPGKITGSETGLSGLEGLTDRKDTSSASPMPLKKITKVGLNADKYIRLFGITKNENQVRVVNLTKGTNYKTGILNRREFNVVDTGFIKAHGCINVFVVGEIINEAFNCLTVLFP